MNDVDVFEAGKRFFLQGIAAFERKDYPAAEAAFKQSLAQIPQRLSTLTNLAAALVALGKFSEARAIATEIIAVDGQAVDGWMTLGIVCAETHDLQQALTHIDQALALDGGHAQAHYNKGKVLCTLRRYTESIASYERALTLNPRYVQAYNNRGIVYQELGRFDEALSDYALAIAMDAADPKAYFNCGVTLSERRRYREAVDHFDHALEIVPGYPYVHGMRVHARMQMFDWDGLAAEIADVAERLARGDKASTPFAALTLHDSPALQLAAARTWVADKHPESSALPALTPYGKHQRIRLGYYSGDFRDHPVAQLMAGLFEAHDRARFEIVAFSFGPEGDGKMRTRIAKAFDRFEDVRYSSDVDIARLSRELEIDIAVDLGGLTGGVRPDIFAHGAAPVQINFLGYPGTMGAPFMDYIVADSIIIPVESREHYAEKIVYLPSYQPNESARMISTRNFTRTEFGLPHDGFVFCSFNNAYKITPGVFDCWMRLLRQVDGSVLWLPTASEEANDRLCKVARRHDVEVSRLVFAARMPLQEEYLARYRLADLFLDTLPYNAHTTASDALWAGLPVLTCAGQSFAARVGASVLHALQLPELITDNLGSYEAMALLLATQPARLALIREKLMRNRESTRLFDLPRYARHIEEAYRQIHELQTSGSPPHHIFVGDVA